MKNPNKKVVKLVRIKNVCLRLPDGEAGMLAILDELAEVGQAILLGLGILLNDGDDGIGNAGLIFETALVSQHA